MYFYKGLFIKSSDLANMSALTNLTILPDAKKWQDENGIHFALWGPDTTGTPYKQGITSASAGILIGGRTSINNQFWIAVDAMGSPYRAHYERSTDTWSQWTAI